MGYVGNEPSVNFTSFAKQDLTGVTGSPAKRGFTLTYAVANANEIEVFVNNVRQEPTEAYTVNGTGLTMTGDVETTDDFYIIYLGKALQTTVTPDGSVGTAKIADSAVTNAKIADGTIADSKLASTFQPTVSVAVIQDEKAYNISGGSSSAGTTYQRDLNTKLFDPDNIVSLSSDQFTLQSGTYIIEWSCPAYRANRHAAWLYNMTSASVEQYGRMSYANSTGNVNNFTHGIARVVLTSATTYIIQHKTESADGNGLGLPLNFLGTTVNGIFTVVKITKLA